MGVITVKSQLSGSPQDHPGNPMYEGSKAIDITNLLLGLTAKFVTLVLGDGGGGGDAWV